MTGCMCTTWWVFLLLSNSVLPFGFLPNAISIRQEARTAGSWLKAFTIDTAASFVIALSGSKLKPFVLLLRVKTIILFARILNRSYDIFWKEKAQGFAVIFTCLQAQISQAVPGSSIALLWQHKQSQAVGTKSFAGCLEVAPLRVFLNAQFKCLIFFNVSSICLQIWKCSFIISKVISIIWYGF